MTSRFALNRRHFLAGAGAATALSGLGAGRAAAQSASITFGTFSGAMNNVIQEIAVPRLLKDHPGANVSLMARASAEAYPRLLVDRANPSEAGGLWNDTFSALAAKENLFADINPDFMPTAAQIPAVLNPAHGKGVAFAIQPYGIAYNPKFVEKPTSWLDLFKPEYVGKVAMHENFWDQYVMLARILGADEYNLSVAIDEWAKHKRNIGVWTTNYTQTEDLLDKGEVWLAPQWGGYTVAAQLRGLDIAFSWPEEGCTQQTIVAATSAGTSPLVNEMTQRLIDAALAPDAQIELLKLAGLSPSNANAVLPAEYAGIEGVIDAKAITKPLYQYDFAHVGSNLQALRREIDQKLR